MLGQGSRPPVDRQAIFRLYRLKPAATNLLFSFKKVIFRARGSPKIFSEKSFDYLVFVQAKNRHYRVASKAFGIRWISLTFSSLKMIVTTSNDRGLFRRLCLER